MLGNPGVKFQPAVKCTPVSRSTVSTLVYWLGAGLVGHSC